MRTPSRGRRLSAVVLTATTFAGVAGAASAQETITGFTDRGAQLQRGYEQRFQEASEVETFWGRIFTIFIGQSVAFDNFTWIGYGIGLGSNLANYVRTGSTGAFALAEVEASRILLEGGLIGYVFTVFKVGVIVVGVRKAWRLSKRLHSAYPILLWAVVSLALLTWSAIGQLTAHGLLGLMLAFGLLVFRHPTVEFFPPRPPSA